MSMLQHRRGGTTGWSSQPQQKYEGSSIPGAKGASKHKGGSSITTSLLGPICNARKRGLLQLSFLVWCGIVVLIFWGTSIGIQSNVPPEMVVESVVKKSLGALYDPPTSIELGDDDDDQKQTSATNSSTPLRWTCIQAIRERQRREIPLDSILINNLMSNEGRALEILLVDPAYHPNVGDHMITEGEHVFFQRTIQRAFKIQRTKGMRHRDSLHYRECGYFQASKYAEPCKDILKKKGNQKKDDTNVVKIAFWHGGGNWGDLWPRIQKFRSESLEQLIQTGYKVYGFPQSLYFAEKEAEVANAQYLSRLSSLLQGNTTTTSTAAMDENRLVLTWREHQSLDRAKKLYPMPTHRLVPDIAFQLGPYEVSTSQSTDATVPAQVDIVLLLRNDHESIYAEQRNRQVITTILSKLSSNNERVSFSIVDWPDRLDRFSDEDQGPDTNFLFTQKAISLLQLGRVVVCDRLHATILAYLSGMSFVYLDQVSGKIEKTMTVALESHPSCFHDQWNQDTTAASGAPLKSGAIRWWSRARNLTRGLELALEILHDQQTGDPNDLRRKRRRTSP